MEELFLAVFNKLEGVDALPAIFIVSIVIIVKVNIKNLSEKGKELTIKLLAAGLFISILNSAIIRIIDIYSQTQGLK